MAGRGKKDCPNCNTELAARCYFCECGYHFPSKKVRKDLLEAKNTAKVPSKAKVYDFAGKGKKKCPDIGCGAIVAAVVKICPKCDFDYVAARKDKKKEKSEAKAAKQAKKAEKDENNGKGKEQATSVVAKELLLLPPYEAPEELTPIEHAERILDYGKEKATALLDISRQKHTSWPHVDWNAVEAGLLQQQEEED